ncbi:MAG: lipid-A-disaccharide synthase [Rhodospirillales bacterium]|nr:lipid-A-disaccharide synthase [Rhodospirillales bacterium]
MAGKPENPLIFLVAGEPSGDILGARLMAALRRRLDGQVRFAGVGGNRMAAEGLESLFPMSELSVMGLAEILPRLPHLLKRIRQTADLAERLRPDIFITIDSPDFSFRVARRLKGKGFPLVHYVAPSVWAWRPGRARKLSKFLDHVIALLPFEPPFFEKVGLPCTFVGHPVIEGGADAGDGAAFRKRYGISSQTPVVCVLPGSRIGEIRRHLPIFEETVQRLGYSRPGLVALVVAVEEHADEIFDACKNWPVLTQEISDSSEEKFDAFAAADVALAASGTVSLELAMAGTPAVIAYKMNLITGWIARLLIRVPYVNLINLVLIRPAVPELLLEQCRPRKLTEAVAGLLDDETLRHTQLESAAEALDLLGRNGPSPSERAAEVVMNFLNKPPEGGV